MSLRLPALRFQQVVADVGSGNVHVGANPFQDLGTQQESFAYRVVRSLDLVERLKTVEAGECHEYEKTAESRHQNDAAIHQREFPLRHAHAGYISSKLPQRSSHPPESAKGPRPVILTDKRRRPRAPRPASTRSSCPPDIPERCRCHRRLSARSGEWRRRACPRRCVRLRGRCGRLPLSSERDASVTLAGGRSARSVRSPYLEMGVTMLLDAAQSYTSGCVDSQ